MARNAPVPMPGIDILKDRFVICHKTGRLLNRRDWRTVRAGTLAGNESDKGYSRVKVFGQLYLSHRVVYFMHYGIDPGEREVDHRDGNPINNHPDNLRLASHGQNQTNGGPFKNNKSGYRGVHFHKQHQKYSASIQKDKKPRHIGLFGRPESAARAYDRAAIRLFGEFAKTNFPIEEYQND